MTTVTGHTIFRPKGWGH